ncbi:MAG: amidophosphoribosyltransferase [Dorea sp.]|nr:amidophosphoribosyltransferase [Dorea sp.]
MGGFFGAAAKHDVVLDVFYGVDYHSHLGTRRGGMAVYGEDGFDRAIHNIENTPFRTKFEKDAASMVGNLGIGCISDTEPQPILIQSLLGSFAICTVGKVNNQDEIIKELYGKHHCFQEMTNGQVNTTELMGALICTKNSILEGIKYVQETIDGSMTMLVMTRDGIYVARDKMGRTPVIVGKCEDGHCVSFESFAYQNLGYTYMKELGPGEIDFVTADEVKVLVEPGDKMRICSFLWVYYGYAPSSYEGQNVEEMRYRCGAALAKRDREAGLQNPDLVAGVPDSGIAHAIGYANESGATYGRAFIKYTPTWPRSFMPTNQKQRELIARMKLIPVHELIQDKKLLIIDDSIVRGTQLRDTTAYLYQSGVKEVHVRPACPPIMFGCKYLNFSRSKSELDLITRRIILEWEGENVSDEVLAEYCDPTNEKYIAMEKEICKRLNFTTLRYNRLDDMLDAIGIDPDKVCTYCFNGIG